MGKVQQASFTAGELTPFLHSRADLQRYVAGLKTASNIIIHPHGGASNRPGLRWVAEVKYSNKFTRLLPFAFNDTDTYALEFGEKYMRVFRNGGQVLRTQVNVTAITKANPAQVTTDANHGLSIGDEVYLASIGGMVEITDGKYTVGHILEASKSITAATKAYPVKITAATHGYTTGDRVYLESLGGMTELNNREFTITVVDANNYTLDGENGLNYTTYTSGGTSKRVDPNDFTLTGVDSTGYTTYTSGGTVDGIYEIPTPYLEAELADLNYVQSNDVVTIVHNSHAVRELRRTGHTAWSLEIVAFEPGIDPPTGANIITQTVGSGSTARTYVVTAVDADTGEESIASNEATVNTADDAGWTAGEYIRVGWNSVAGAGKYNVYKEKNGIFGFIGSTEDLQFDDDKISPELGDTPPKARDPFNGTGNYPAVATYYEQRLAFASTLNAPQKIWFSQTGNFHNFGVSEPTKADDAITLTIDASQVNIVRGMVPMSDLIVLTTGAEQKISSGENAFSLANLQVKPQSFRGSAKVRPLLMGSGLLYLQDKGQIVRDFAYALESDSYKGNDLSVLSQHLFENYSIDDWSYAQSPHSLVWCVRSDGAALSMTYMKEHEVWAWTQQHTDGAFESVAVVSEGMEDVPYFVVNRTIDGSTRRYIERMESRSVPGNDVKNAFFVDCGATYNGAPTTTISGLDWLEGKTVTILANGNVHPAKVVTNGSIALDYDASLVHIGLPYLTVLETLEPPLENAGHGTIKSASRLIVKVLNSRGMWAGPDANNMVELKQRTSEPWGEPIALYTGEFELIIQPKWKRGQLRIEQRDPLPLTITAIIPDYEVGG